MKKLLTLAVITLALGACSQSAAETNPAPKAAETAPVSKPADVAQPKQEETTVPATQQVTYEMVVKGMMCDGCKATVTGLIKGVDGVESADVDLKTGRAIIKLKPGAKVDAEKLTAAVDSDYEVASCKVLAQ